MQYASQGTNRVENERWKQIETEIDSGNLGPSRQETEYYPRR